MHEPMVRRLFVAAGLTVLLLLPGTVTAQDGPHYTWVEGGYTDVDPDGDLFDSGDGWFLGGSFRLQAFHLFAEYSTLTVPGSGMNPELKQTQWLAGGGWHGLMGAPADLVVEAAFVSTDISLDGSDTGDSGYLGQLGIRWMVLPLLELDGFYRYIDLFDETESLYVIDAIVWIKRYGIGATWEKADSGDAFNVFLRINIGS